MAILIVVAGLVFGMTGCFFGSFCLPPVPVLSKMYVVNYDNNTVTVANLDGTGGTALAVATLNAPTAIALDVAAGKMYVTNGGNDTVTEANLDGTGGVSLGSLGGTLNYPGGIAFGP